MGRVVLTLGGGQRFKEVYVQVSSHDGSMGMVDHTYEFIIEINEIHVGTYTKINYSCR